MVGKLGEMLGTERKLKIKRVSGGLEDLHPPLRRLSQKRYARSVPAQFIPRLSNEQ